jgi:LmbE family N-acetylglucosaminyl deacetylase
MLAVFAHPDDEGLVTGVFARYHNEGARVALICATRGEEGEIAPGVECAPENLGAWREQELRSAMSHVPLDQIYFLDYRDSGMDGTPANQNPVNLHNAPLADVTRKVVGIIREVRPQVLVTFDPNGGYGHPDHIKMHHATMAAWDQAGDPTCYPEQLTNGLEPYAPSKLYWTAFSREFFMKAAQYLKDHGHDISMFGPLNPQRRAMSENKVTTRIDVRPYLEIKNRAWAAHASQHNPRGMFSLIPPELVNEWRQFETFTLVKARVDDPPGIEEDLFAGVR